MTDTRAPVADVTVVIPTRNRSTLLAEAVESVRAQTHAPREIVVVDDGSDPEHLGILTELASRGVRVLRNDRSRGGSAARNRGWREATTRWIAFLDDDDLFDPEKIGRQVRVMEETGARWSWTDYRMVERESMAFVDEIRPRDPTFTAVLARSHLSNCTLMVERSLLEEVGGYDEVLPRNQDRDLFLRLLRAAPGVPVEGAGPLTTVRWHVPDPRACIEGEDRFHQKWMRAIDELPLFERRRIRAERHWLNWSNRARLDDRRAELAEILGALRIRPWVPRYWRSLLLAILHLLGWSGRHGGRSPRDAHGATRRGGD